MKLIVGCPVYNRDWVLERWYQHLEEWRQHGVDLFYVFIVTGKVPDLVRRIPRSRCVVEIDLWQQGGGVPALKVGGPDGSRDWNKPERIDEMVKLRNQLKDAVASISRTEFLDCHAFLSIDSDILVAPWEQSKRLFNDLQGKDAVSPLVYLGVKETNAFVRRDPKRQATRVYQIDYMQDVDILCAAKLQTMEMVWDQRVKYAFDPRGEDFGWSANARQYRYQLAFDPVVKWKHIMEGKQLDTVDRRLGW